MSGQASPLSLAAFGGSSYSGKWSGGRWAKTSSCGAGSIAIFTASSNRSNSASLIALSGVFRERRVSNLVCLQIEPIVQIVSIESMVAYLVTGILIPRRTVDRHRHDQI